MQWSKMVAFRRQRSRAWWTVLGLNFRGEVARMRTFSLQFRWGNGHSEGMGIYVALYFAVWLTWEMPWGLRKRLPAWPRDDREVGLNWNSGTLRLLFVREAMGTYYGRRKGRFGRVRTAWMNKELTLWRNTWIVGRDRHHKVNLDERMVTINCGRWPGDEYPARQTIEHATWRNRFRTIERTSIWWMIEGNRGIPTDTKGKWGDRYGITMGFGADAPDAPVAELVELAPSVLANRLQSLLKEWPDGLVAEMDEVSA